MGVWWEGEKKKKKDLRQLTVVCVIDSKSLAVDKTQPVPGAMAAVIRGLLP